MRRNMYIKAQPAIEKYYGQPVDLSFLGGDAVFKLSEEERASLKEGGILRAVRGKRNVVIGSCLSEAGGQGVIYRSDIPGCVLKIYHEKERTKFTKNKLSKILEFQNENPHICWPTDILETQSGVFVGFVMPEVQGIQLDAILTGRADRIKNSYPQYSRLTQIEMILKMLEAFRYLHDHNILVGDIKTDNVMFHSDTFAVTLVDMDSVQIGEYYCGVSTLGYNPPEIIGCLGEDGYEKDPEGTYLYNCYYKQRYREEKHEQFALSVLLYRFLMNGRWPYNYEDLGRWEEVKNEEQDADELCLKRLFPFALSEEETAQICKNDRAETGCWSHFPSFLKEAFVDAFKNDKRHTDEEWIAIFSQYRALLVSGRLEKRDAFCMDPIPEPEHVIDYNAVTFGAMQAIERTGFAMWRVVSKIVEQIKDRQLKKHIDYIAKVLKQENECIVDQYRFTLIYNIGVLKKIKCENVL